MDEKKNQKRLDEMLKKIKKMPIFQGNEDLKIDEINLSESYNSLERFAELFRYEIKLGKQQLIEALHVLSKPTAGSKERAKALIVSIQMLSELLRLMDVKEFICLNYEYGEVPDPLLVNLENNWESMSELLLEWLDGKKVEIKINNKDYTGPEILRAIFVAKDSTASTKSGT